MYFVHLLPKNLLDERGIRLFVCNLCFGMQHRPLGACELLRCSLRDVGGFIGIVDCQSLT